MSPPFWYRRRVREKRLFRKRLNLRFGGTAFNTNEEVECERDAIGGETCVIILELDESPELKPEAKGRVQRQKYPIINIILCRDKNERLLQDEVEEHMLSLVIFL